MKTFLKLHTFKEKHSFPDSTQSYTLLHHFTEACFSGWGL